jgi:hypothetical protein
MSSVLENFLRDHFVDGTGQFGHPWNFCCRFQTDTFVYGLVCLGLNDIVDAFNFFVTYGKCQFCGQSAADVLCHNFPRSSYIANKVYQVAT